MSRRKQEGRGSLLDKVRAKYLSDAETGLVTAIRESLKSLFAEPRLPDNPYYYLASTLSAYVDQDKLWKTPELALAGAFDDDGGLEMLDASTKLCRLAGQGKAWGLPHVLRLASKQGVSILYDVLFNSMPDSFFPGPSSFANQEGYQVQVLSTVQGVSAIWRPQWMELPALVVQADVVVRGPRPEGAIAAMAELVVQDLLDLEEVPVYFVTSVGLTEGLPTRRAAGERRAKISTPCMPLSEMIARPDDWRRQLMRGVLSGKVLEVQAVLLLEASEDGKNLKNRRHRFVMVRKRYLLHFVPSNDSQYESASSYNAMAFTASHYGSIPYEAMYEGYFLDVAAARQYIMLWLASQRAPYRQANLTANMDQLMDLVEHDFSSGATLEALRRLLLLVMLQDPRVLSNAVRTAGGPGGLPGMLLTMEELLAVTGPTEEQRLALGAVPNLIRMLNTGAATLEGVVNELEALTLVSIAWPERHARLAAATANVPLSSHAQRSKGAPAQQGGTKDAAGASKEGGGGEVVEGFDEQQMALEELKGRASWLRDFDMEGHLLVQLQGLQARIGAVTGGGVFSGISVLVDALMMRLGAVLCGQPLPNASPESAQQHLQPLFASWTEAEADPQMAYWNKLRHAHKNAAAGEWFSSCDVVHGGDPNGGGSQLQPGLNRRFSQVWTHKVVDGGDARPWSGPIWQQHTRVVLQELKTMLGAAGLTLADGLLDRCRNVQYVMRAFNLTAYDAMMSRASSHEADAVAVEWVLNVTEVTDAQVRSGALAERVAVEGVMLQYAIDVKLDQMLSDCYRVLTEPPMPVNPYPQLLHYMRAYAARLELWKEDMPSMVEQRCNQLTLLQPPSFIYAARPPAAAPTSALLQPSRNRQQDMEDEGDEGLMVYGCYAAVTLCDIRAMHTLASSLGGLLAERCSQIGAYDITVLPALTGAASISAALQLEDDQDSRMAALGPGSAAADAGKAQKGAQQGAAAGAGTARPPYEHPRWYGVESEEHHLFVGPQCQTAASMFATGVVDYALQLHKDTMHLMQDISVGSSCYTLTQLLQPEGKQACIHALMAAAVKAVTQDQDLPGALQHAARPLGMLRMLVVVREGMYVPLTKLLLFQYRKVGLSQTTSNTGDDAQRYGAIGHMLSAANCPEPHWPPEVYQRVFLSAAAATTWWQWNRALGDPGQPYHVRHLLAFLQQLVHEQEAQGELLATQKLLLLAATASQDVELLYHVMHAMASKAQELQQLQSLNTTLVQLMTISDTEQLAKLDTERLRRLFLLYTSRMHRAARSPKYCYFSGFAAAAPQLLAALKEQVLTEYKLQAEHIERMAQLQLWTRCCEVSVADSIHDCFNRDLIDRLLERVGLQDEEESGSGGPGQPHPTAKMPANAST